MEPGTARLLPNPQESHLSTGDQCGLLPALSFEIKAHTIGGGARNYVAMAFVACAGD